MRFMPGIFFNTRSDQTRQLPTLDKAGTVAGLKQSPGQSIQRLIKA
jgi:hypothetical protein